MGTQTNVLNTLKVLVVLLLVLPATAAAAPPTASTTAAADVTQTSATLTGSVNPKGNLTTVYFKFGETNAYGFRTADIAAGEGTKAIKLTSLITGLAPNATVHFRMIAVYGDKEVTGGDKSFKTKPQPLGLTLTPSPEIVKFSRGTTLNGNLSGSNNTGRQVRLLANPFPYAGFVPVLNPQVISDPGGAFAFTVPSVTVNTQFLVQVPGKPEIVSPVVAVGVRVSVSTSVKKRKRHRYRFSGKLAPQADDAVVTIQRKQGSRWKNLVATFARHRSDGTSHYAKTVKIRKKGRYRVAVSSVPQQFVGSAGRVVRIR